MKWWWTVTRRSWAELGTYLCFTIFGVMCIINPLPSQNNTPPFFTALFNLEVAIAGLFLIASVYSDWHWHRIIGYTIYSLGMFTIGGLIALGSGSATSILVLGFGLQGVMSARYLSRERVLSRDLATVIQEMTERRDDE